MSRWLPARILLIATFAAAPMSAGDFKSLAKELSRAGQAAGLRRVAVLPFSSADGQAAGDGSVVSERLLTALVRLNRLQTVERSLLRQLLEEHQLGRTGLLEPSALRRLGSMASADGIVTGTYALADGEILVQARLVAIDTGLILAAAERRLARDWAQPQNLASNSPLFVPAPEFTVEAPVITSEEDMRDSLASDSCSDAAERIDSLETRILELKARYWAGQLKRGVSLSQLRYNPGSTISDPELKRKLYDRMKVWYTQERVPELSPAEMQAFVAIDQQALGIYRRCGT
ncbi:MAG: hypothetical protein HY550_04325 [Elusimicrobia bacterium]|nr:hypothetical protein [Elusimicrobiota bacterium]